jgi:quinone-modifying oxidoreductase subunit QmoB
MVPVTKDDPVVNLAYRQGPAFRDIGLFNGYADSNFICFPYETQRTGIYAAGAVRRSMTMEESMEDASGAALKAIQCLESVNRGVGSSALRRHDLPGFLLPALHPVQTLHGRVSLRRLDDDEKGTPKPNPTRCRRCGTCMGACPERIIGFADYNIDSIGSMVKAVGVPSEDDIPNRPCVFWGLVCENDAYPALDMAGLNRSVLLGRCAPHSGALPGSVNVIWIKDALSQGMDGVFLLGCKHGDDYQCHFVKGSELADIRMKKIGDALASLALEKNGWPSLNRHRRIRQGSADHQRFRGIHRGAWTEFKGFPNPPFPPFFQGFLMARPQRRPSVAGGLYRQLPGGHHHDPHLFRCRWRFCLGTETVPE